MAIDTLGHILEELSVLMNGKLTSNQNSTCMFKFNDTCVQLEVDKKGEHLLIVAELGTVPVGKYRETLFQEALKQNGIAESSSGSFAYSKQADTLILFDMLHVKDANGQKVFDLLTPFCTKAKSWTEAITRGEIPLTSTVAATGGTRGLFGFRP